MKPTHEDAQLFADCFNRNGSEKELANVQWQLLENPVDKLYVDFAESDSGDLAAIYASAPNRFKVAEQTVTAVQSLDTLTDAEYRGKGLFKKLAASVFGRCEQESVDFIYGFPNGNSAHGFFNRLGWTSLDPVPFLVCPLRSGYFASRAPVLKKISRWIPDIPLAKPRMPVLPEGHAIRAALSWDEFDIEGISEEFSSTYQVGIVRDKAYLKWRTSKPQENYKTLVYYVGDEAKAVIVYAVKEKHGGRIGYILELMHPAGGESMGTALLRHALRDMVRQKTDAVLAWCFSHSANYSSFRRSGFWTLPMRLRPIELHMGVKPLASKDLANLLKRENWYVSYCDSDTV